MGILWFLTFLALRCVAIPTNSVPRRFPLSTPGASIMLVFFPHRPPSQLEPPRPTFAVMTPLFDSTPFLANTVPTAIAHGSHFFFFKRFSPLSRLLKFTKYPTNPPKPPTFPLLPPPLPPPYLMDCLIVTSLRLPCSSRDFYFLRPGIPMAGLVFVFFSPSNLFRSLSSFSFQRLIDIKFIPNTPT